MSAPSLTLLADRRAREGSPGGEPRLEVRGPAPKRILARKQVPAPTPLAGLTTDERRVHQILLGALARSNTAAHIGSGLTYSEKKHLVDMLDLSFLDTQIRRMERQHAQTTNAARAGLIGAVIGGPPVVAFLLGSGAPVMPFIIGFAVLMVACIAALVRGRPSETPERQQIYEALRELALVVDGGAARVSEALLRADLLIDTFASADPSEAPRGAARVRS